MNELVKNHPFVYEDLLILEVYVDEFDPPFALIHLIELHNCSFVFIK